LGRHSARQHLRAPGRPLLVVRGRAQLARVARSDREDPPARERGGALLLAPPMGPDVHGREIGPAAELPARGWRERADPLLAAVIFALFARTFLFQAFVVPSPSMEKNVLT